jgi:hypothetical protein
MTECSHSGYLIKIPESENFFCRMCYKQFTLNAVKKGLYATIPEGIKVFLDINSGDKLQWKMDKRNDEEIVIVTKKPNDTPQKESGS